ncbi:unnamed protein product [Lupinus luteus]|uniref:Uncharacterized protein n=1 Tax=Lupinus luteus TaxID=3873 RepID=A0AAV1WNV3_LUPLU
MVEKFGPILRKQDRKMPEKSVSCLHLSTRSVLSTLKPKARSVPLLVGLVIGQVRSNSRYWKFFVLSASLRSASQWALSHHLLPPYYQSRRSSVGTFKTLPLQSVLPLLMSLKCSDSTSVTAYVSNSQPGTESTPGFEEWEQLVQLSSRDIEQRTFEQATLPQPEMRGKVDFTRILDLIFNPTSLNDAMG